LKTGRWENVEYYGEPPPLENMCSKATYRDRYLQLVREITERKKEESRMLETARARQEVAIKRMDQREGQKQKEEK